MTVNADPHELAKFGDLAHRWWDPESEFKPLHQINPLRLDWIDRLSPLQGRRVLDVGCGGGILSESMARRGAQSVLGIDLATKAIKVARLHAMEAGLGGLEYEEVAAEVLAQREPSGFDVVTCLEMLEHVPDPGAIVRSCASLVRPGGWVFFSTLNRNAKAFAFAIVGAEYLLKLVPRGTHEYARFIRPAELAGLCREAGLELVETCGLGYNPLLKRYQLGADVDVNYMLACRRPQA